MGPLETKEWVRELAARQGFVAAGVAAADCSLPTGPLEQFLQNGYHAGMAYLVRQGMGRLDVRSVLPQAQSVICLAVSYAPAPGDPANAHVARYARGRDYHRLLRRRCEKIVAQLRTHKADLAAKICVDSAPLSDRSLAAAAGLGWIGRNGCLINPRWGSYLLLAEIVTDLPLPPDSPIPSRCGDCRRCIQACPGQAIVADGLVDCRRCNSYLTIEHRGQIPPDRRRQIGQRVFGCDACQEACPFNQGAPAGLEEFRRPTAMAGMSPRQLLRLSRAGWEEFSPGSPLRRCGYDGLLRNAAIACENAS
jgi:epoxyqueuosine reductase